MQDLIGKFAEYVAEQKASGRVMTTEEIIALKEGYLLGLRAMRDSMVYDLNATIADVVDSTTEVIDHLEIHWE